MAEPTIIERSVEKAHIWINEMAAELDTDDHREAYRALRDRLPVDETAQLLRRHVSAGEIDDIRAVLPEDLRPALG